MRYNYLKSKFEKEEMKKIENVASDNEGGNTTSEASSSSDNDLEIEDISESKSSTDNTSSTDNMTTLKIRIDNGRNETDKIPFVLTIKNTLKVKEVTEMIRRKLGCGDKDFQVRSSFPTKLYEGSMLEEKLIDVGLGSNASLIVRILK